MASSSIVIYCTVFASISLAMAFYAVVERQKLAGLSTGIWIALRALLFTAVLAVWAPPVAATIGHLAKTSDGAATSPTSLVPSTAAGAAITVCTAIGVTIVVVYLYRCLWQLGTVQPRLRRQPTE